MGNVVGMIAWAVPLTIMNIYRNNQERARQSDDSAEGDSHKFNSDFYHFYPPAKKCNSNSEKNFHPMNSYKLCTRHGRTSYYPIDPYFKKLNASTMKTPCPKFRIETVFAESQHLFRMKNAHDAPQQENKKFNADPDSGTNYEEVRPTISTGDKAESQFEDVSKPFLHGESSQEIIMRRKQSSASASN